MQVKGIMRFEDLEIWKRSARLSSDLYKHFRDSKDFGFRDQITRSGLSIPSNIAEGIERGGDREVIRFLSIAKGSCGELRTQVYIGCDIGYIDKEVAKKWIKETQEVSAMISAFIKHRENNLANAVHENPEQYNTQSPAPCHLNPVPF